MCKQNVVYNSSKRIFNVSALIKMFYPKNLNSTLHSANVCINTSWSIIVKLLTIVSLAILFRKDFKEIAMYMNTVSIGKVKCPDGKITYKKEHSQWENLPQGNALVRDYYFSMRKSEINLTALSNENTKIEKNYSQQQQQQLKKWKQE